jgi:hypothetical protein
MTKVVKIYGGLGNQIFQYVFGKYLEKKYNCEVKFDLYYYNIFNYRDPSILKLVKNISILNDKSVFFKYNPAKSFRINKIWNSIFNSKSYFTDNDDIENLTSYVSNDMFVYFDGYWQKGDYFTHFPFEIMQSFFDFTPAKFDCNIIKIHVRRGDYLSLSNSKIFYVQEAKYYVDSLDYLFKTYRLDKQSINVLVYTDDPDWVKSNFNFEYSLVIGTEIDDFVSLCCSKYLITSNSTFSLAAAYLNYENNIAITPELWYKDINRNQNYISKLYLSKWKSI